MTSRHSLSGKNYKKYNRSLGLNRPSLLLALEPRMMFDGAGVATAGAAVDAVPADTTLPPAVPETIATDEASPAPSQTEQQQTDLPAVPSAEQQDGDDDHGETSVEDKDTAVPVSGQNSDGETSADTVITSSTADDETSEQADAADFEDAATGENTADNPATSIDQLLADVNQTLKDAEALTESLQPGNGNTAGPTETQPGEIDPATAQHTSETQDDPAQAEPSPADPVEPPDNSDPTADVEPAALAAAGGPTVREVVFIDTGVADYEALLADLIGTLNTTRDTQADVPESTSTASQSTMHSEDSGADLLPEAVDETTQGAAHGSETPTPAKAAAPDSRAEDSVWTVGNIQVVLLDEQQDGVRQIRDTLDGLQGIAGVHIVSHGTKGAVKLGNTWLRNDNLSDYSAEIAEWGHAFSEGGDLLFYGCDLALDDQGRSLIDSIGNLTSADVAASTDSTGHESFGGDWVLEYRTGSVETELAVSDSTQAAWRHLLAVVTFQNGVSGYTGTRDTYITDDDPSTSYGSLTSLTVDDDDPESQGLIRFENIFGTGAGQIPLGSTIISASITVDVFDTASGATISLHQMLVSWSESSTWNSLVSGVQTNNVEAESVADATFTNTGSSGAVTLTGLESTLQSWSDGATNYGWVLNTNSDNGWDFRTSETGTIADRPILTVEYEPTPPVVATSGGSTAYSEQATALAIDSSFSLVDPDGSGGSDPSDQYTAVVQITANYEADDVLGFTDTADIQGVRVGDTLTLSVKSGRTASITDFETALQSVTFYNGSDDPGTLNRTVSFTFDDGIDSSNTATKTVTVARVNDAPTVSLANTTTSLAEDADTSSRVKVADIVVNDDSQGTNTLSLSGADAALFEIVGSELFIQAGTSLDFETNPTLDVTVEVDDTSVGGTPDDTSALAVTITDVNEAPSVSLANTTTTLPEDTDTSSRVKVADIVVTDDALGTNTLTLTGTDAALFEIVGSELFIQAGTALDFETNPTLNVTVEVDDTSVGATPDDTAALAITVTDVNEPPSVSLANTTTTLPEDTDTSSRIKVADIVITDDALGTNTLALSGADAALFEIIGTELFVQAGTALDFETNPTLDVTVEVNDTTVGSTPDDTAALAISITDVNEPPSVSLANTTTTLPEDTDTSSRVKVADIVITDDALGTNTLALSGADAALFEIVGTELFIQAGTTLDFETNPSLDVTVEIDDTAVGSTPDDSAALAISVTDVNEPPSVSLANTTTTLPEDTDTSSRIKVADIVITDDALGTNTLALSGADAALFEIIGTELFIQAGTALDFETNPTLDVTVEVDDTAVGATPDDTAALAVSVTDVNEPPSVSLANTTTTLPEDTDTSSRIKVADIVVSDDALGTNTLALSGADAALFEIIGTELFIQAGSALDFETNPTLDVTVEVDDTAVGATPDDTAALAISITDVNEPPSVSLANTTTTLPENTDTSSRVKVADIVITDDALGTNTLALSGTDAALFEIIGTELFIQAGTALDFETNPTLDVTVEVDDTAVGSTPDDTAALAISVTDVNEPPSVSLANTTTTLPEDTDTSSRVKVADIVITDDALGTNTLALSGADAALFEIIGTELFIQAGTALDFETNPSLDVAVEIDDTAVGATPDDTAALAVTITDVNEPPSVSLANTTTTLPEDTDTSSRVKVADIVVSDDALGTNTLAVSGADAALFEIIGTELFIQAGASLDFETNPTLDVTVEVDDTAVGTTPDDTAALAISITDVNEPPTVSLANTTTTLAENTDTSSRVKVADIVITDDALGTNTLSLSGADAALFEIVGTELFIQAGAALDFETNPTLDVTVEVDDTSVGSTPDDTAALAISITDVNEPPSVSLANTTTTLPEDTDTSSRIKVADIVVTDDALGTNSLALSGADAALFEIIGTELFIQAGTTLDFETNPTLDVTVEVDDTAVGATPDDTAALAISITDINEPPSVSVANTTTTLPEDTDTSSRVKVADIVITDDALGSNNLTLSGADAALFEIIGTELFIQAGASLDFETNPTLDVTVEVDDTAVGTTPDDTAALAISITDVNEPPTVSLANTTTTLAENTDTSSRVKVADIVVTDDALGTNTLSLSGADAALFEIIGTELFIQAGTSLDFETNPALDVTVEVDDTAVGSTPDDTAALAISITDVNEPPSVSLANTTTTLPEDTDTSSRIKVADIVVTDDALGTNSLALSGADAALFEIIGTELFIQAGTALDFETNPTLDVTVEVDDTATGGTPDDTVALAISITDVNEPPTVSLANTTTTLSEDTDTSSRVKVADIVIADDALGTNNLTLSGADAALFEIIGTELFIQAGTVLDFEAAPTLDVTVEVDDPGLGATPDDTAGLTIAVTDANEPPSLRLDNVVATLAENTDTSTRIKIADIVITDDALGNNTLFLTGADAAAFEIVGTELFLRAGFVLDFESDPLLEVFVNIDDGTIAGTPEDKLTLSIDVTDVNEPAAVVESDDTPEPEPDVPDDNGPVSKDPLSHNLFDNGDGGTPEMEPMESEGTSTSADEAIATLRNVATGVGFDDPAKVLGLRGFTEGIHFKPYLARPPFLSVDLNSIPALVLTDLSSPAVAALQIPAALFDMLDRIASEMDKKGTHSAGSFDVVTVGVGSAVALSAGYVAWLLRVGALAAAAATIAPLWRQLDPLLVLSNSARRPGDTGETTPARDRGGDVDNWFERGGDDSRRNRQPQP